MRACGTAKEPPALVNGAADGDNGEDFARVFSGVPSISSRGDCPDGEPRTLFPTCLERPVDRCRPSARRGSEAGGCLVSARAGRFGGYPAAPLAAADAAAAVPLAGLEPRAARRCGGRAARAGIGPPRGRADLLLVAGQAGDKLPRACRLPGAQTRLGVPVNVNATACLKVQRRRADRRRRRRGAVLGRIVRHEFEQALRSAARSPSISASPRSSEVDQFARAYQQAGLKVDFIFADWRSTDRSITTGHAAAHARAAGSGFKTGQLPRVPEDRRDLRSRLQRSVFANPILERFPHAGRQLRRLSRRLPLLVRLFRDVRRASRISPTSGARYRLRAGVPGNRLHCDAGRLHLVPDLHLVRASTTATTAGSTTCCWSPARRAEHARRFHRQLRTLEHDRRRA